MLVGFSGGADSLCLLLIINELRGELDLRLGAAYLDHGLRADGERSEEGGFVRGIARRLSLPLHTEVLPPGSLLEEAQTYGLSLEEAARNSRYTFFNRVLSEKQYDYLLLGHHEDDQIETQIMRFFQGAGIGGLAGMKAVNGNILRPILSLPKAEIIEYLKKKGERWITDSSNIKNDFLRNKIRNEFIREVGTIFPGYRKALLNINNKMRSADRFITGETESRLAWVEEPHGFSLESDLFFSTPKFLILQSLYTLYNKTCPARGRAPYRFFNTLPEDPDGFIQRKANGILLEGLGIALKIEKERVFWGRDIVFPKKNSYLIMVNCDCSFSIGEYDFKIELMKRKAVFGGGIYIRVDEITPPFFLRSRHPGDEIQLHEGKKKLKKLFNSWGILESDRWKIPVLADRSGILGVLGGPWGGRNRFSAGDKVNNKTGDDLCYVIRWSLREY